MIAALPYDKPFPSATILVPIVRLKGDQLCFRPDGPLRPYEGAPERLVFDFADLAEAPERAFLRMCCNFEKSDGGSRTSYGGDRARDLPPLSATRQRATAEGAARPARAAAEGQGREERVAVR